MTPTPERREESLFAEVVRHFDRWCLMIEGKLWPGVHFKSGAEINSESSAQYYADILNAAFAKARAEDREAIFKAWIENTPDGFAEYVNSVRSKAKGA